MTAVVVTNSLNTCLTLMFMTLQAEVAMRQEGKPGMSDEEVRLFNLHLP